ncbi:hypothetical protein [Mycolicibacterium vanbaalenii]|uniref:hypothetical protein n=1 Tax=Mycolicibacterium vanbaalenii TaxID=110539 RepID=UPI0023BAED7F|nr:hypothetical protein [Mycolicibacterium vanbaalenii]
MDQGWSPKLISQVLARDAGSAKVKRVSHETIYQSCMSKPVASYALICTNVCPPHELSASRAVRLNDAAGSAT